MVGRRKRALELAEQGARQRSDARWNGCCQSGGVQLGVVHDHRAETAMTDREPTNDESGASTQGDPSDAQDGQSSRGKDVMRGRSFAGANIANTQKEQTRDRQRVVDRGGESLDEINEVTDAEIEARESNED